MKASLGTSGRTWPMLIDLDKDDCRRMLRRFELEAYANVMTALRAQGDLNLERRKVLRDLADIFSIPIERHKCEVRRVLNDERLYTIAYNISGPSVFQEWTIEGKRLIPLIPRIEPLTAFTSLANKYASIEAKKNAALVTPSVTRSLRIKPKEIIAKKPPPPPPQEIPFKKAKLSGDTGSGKPTAVETKNNIQDGHNNVNNSLPPPPLPLPAPTSGSTSKRSKSQDTKAEKEAKKQLGKGPPPPPISYSISSSTAPLPTHLPSTSASASPYPPPPPHSAVSQPQLPVVFQTHPPSLPTITTPQPPISTPTKKTKVASSPAAKVAITQPEVSFPGPTSTISVPATARRVISISPSTAKITTSKALKNSTDLILGHLPGSNLGKNVVTSVSGTSGSNIITSIVSQNALASTLITGGNIAHPHHHHPHHQTPEKGSIVNIVPIGTVSQHRILQHSSGPAGSSNPGQMIPQQVFVIPAAVDGKQQVTKVSTFPVQVGSGGELHHHPHHHHQILHHPGPKPGAGSGNFAGQQTPKIISIPLESTKPNFLSGKPKFTYGMKPLPAGVTPKVTIQPPLTVTQPAPQQQPQLQETGSAEKVQMPMTLVSTSSSSQPVQMTFSNLPVTVTTLPVTVTNHPITSMASGPSSMQGQIPVSVTLPNMISVPVTTVPQMPSTIPVTLAPLPPPTQPVAPPPPQAPSLPVTNAPTLPPPPPTLPVAPPSLPVPPPPAPVAVQVTVATLPVKPAIMPIVTPTPPPAPQPEVTAPTLPITVHTLSPLPAPSTLPLPPVSNAVESSSSAIALASRIEEVSSQEANPHPPPPPPATPPTIQTPTTPVKEADTPGPVSEDN